MAQAAERLIGAPFRLHGRDPATGLDCIGVLAAAARACGLAVNWPTGYPLRLSRLDAWLPPPQALGFTEVSGPVEPGDAIMLTPGPAQFHIAIAAQGGGWIHAHAGLRRVVLTPELPAGPIIAHWRIGNSSTPETD